MKEAPVIVSQEIAAQTDLFTVEKLHLHFSNGQERVYERIIGHGLGSVMMIPRLDANTILLVQEYAAGLENYILGFPKGAIDPGETWRQAANRELMEEVGYMADNLTMLHSFSSMPAYFSSHMHVVIANQLAPKKLRGDEPEALEVVPWKLSQIDALLAHPQFIEARSIAALLLLQRHLHG